MYITYVAESTKVIPSIRMTRKEAIKSTFNSAPTSKHTKGFFETRTFKTDAPREYDFRPFEARLRNIPTEFEKNYYTFKIPKASGGFRTIEAPSDNLKDIQSRIVNIIYDMQVLPHTASYAYTKGRSAYDALVTHQRANARWFLKIDIKDFFPSIDKETLYNMFDEVYPLGLLREDSKKNIINIAVNEDLVLPQGSPLSPMLSNLVMLGFDHTLTKELRRFKGQTYTYTRYADDLLITCPYEFKFQDIVDLVEQTFHKHRLPFRINKQKLRYASMAGRNWNLGLMYTADQKITVGQQRKRMLHSLVNSFVIDYAKEEPWSTLDIQSLQGNLAYLKNIEPEYHDTLIHKYNKKYNVDVYQLFNSILCM